MTIKLRLSPVALALAVGTTGCSDLIGQSADLVSGPGTVTGEFGGTPGGAQDIGFVRAQIEAGMVPLGSEVSAEGLFSEHDLGTVGPPCESLLCLRPALAAAPELAGDAPYYWVQLGMSSGLDPATWQRPALDAVVLIDRSSSMSIDMTETNAAVTTLIDQLRDDDRLAILTVNDQVRELKALGPVEDPETLKRDVQAIRAEGGWNMELGLREAYRIAHSAGEDPKRLRRVFVLSCGYPDIQGDSPEGARQIIKEGARERIGLTFVGVLLAFDFELANFLSQERGGSLHYVQDLDKVEQVFAKEFDTMVTPLAYDLSLSLDLAEGVEIDRSYGLPGERGAKSQSLLDVNTVFLSHRRGGILLRLRANDVTEGLLGNVKMAYQGDPAHQMATADESHPLMASSEDTAPHYQGDGVRKMIALAQQAEQMTVACDAFHEGEALVARTTLEQLIEYLEGENRMLQDEGLTKEITLVRRLRQNMMP